MSSNENDNQMEEEYNDEILYLEDRINDLMKIYKEEYTKYTKM